MKKTLLSLFLCLLPQLTWGVERKGVFSYPSEQAPQSKNQQDWLCISHSDDWEDIAPMAKPRGQIDIRIAGQLGKEAIQKPKKEDDELKYIPDWVKDPSFAQDFLEGFPEDEAKKAYVQKAEPTVVSALLRRIGARGLSSFFFYHDREKKDKLINLFTEEYLKSKEEIQEILSLYVGSKAPEGPSCHQRGAFMIFVSNQRPNNPNDGIEEESSSEYLQEKRNNSILLNSIIKSFDYMTNSAIDATLTDAVEYSENTDQDSSDESDQDGRMTRLRKVTRTHPYIIRFIKKIGEETKNLYAKERCQNKVEKLLLLERVGKKKLKPCGHQHLDKNVDIKGSLL